MKQRIVFILLAVFLGSFGVHNFYAGYKRNALIQLLVTLLTCGTGAIFMQIWAIVEACTVLVDAEGKKLE